VSIPKGFFSSLTSTFNGHIESAGGNLDDSAPEQEDILGNISELRSGITELIDRGEPYELSLK
jgi:hypothetical protein